MKKGKAELTHKKVGEGKGRRGAGGEEEDKKVHREFFLRLFSIRHEFCSLLYTCSELLFFAKYCGICWFYTIIGEGAHLKY